MMSRPGECVSALTAFFWGRGFERLDEDLGVWEERVG